MPMQAKIVAVLVIASALGGSFLRAQSPAPLNAQVTVTELPPEAIPTGTCKESYSGYLEIPERGKVRNKNFTPLQIGDYTKKRLAEGYSLSLYPQASGRLFVIETCQSAKR